MRAALALGAAVVAGAAALLVPTVLVKAGAEAPDAPASVSATVTLAPRAHLFGDRVRAAVDVVFDPRRVDSRSVSIDARFTPYATVDPVRLVRTDGRVRLEATLVCLKRECVAAEPTREVRFPPARIRYWREGRERTLSKEWPPLLVATRLAAPDRFSMVLRVRDEPGPLAARVDPLVLGWGLAAAAALLVGAAGAAVARRLRATPRLEVATPERLGALKQALAAVDRLVVEAEAARRSALDRLAHALDQAGRGHLARRARVLAWSRPVPSTAPMEQLAQEVREVVDEAAGR